MKVGGVVVARAVGAVLAMGVFTLACRSTPPLAQARPCGAGGPFYAETPADDIVRSSAQLDSVDVVGHGAVVVRLMERWPDHAAVGAKVRLAAGIRMLTPADDPTSDTDGIHTFLSVPAGHYVVQIAYIGYHIQTLAHEVRSGIIDTLTVKLLRGAICLNH
jgi:hypothetical protein